MDKVAAIVERIGLACAKANRIEKKKKMRIAGLTGKAGFKK